MSRWTVTDWYREQAEAVGMTGTHAGCLNALSELMEGLESCALLHGTHVKAIFALVKHLTFPDAEYLSGATPDEFLGIYECIHMILTTLDEEPIKVLGLANDWLADQEVFA